MSSAATLSGMPVALLIVLFEAVGTRGDQTRLGWTLAPAPESGYRRSATE